MSLPIAAAAVSISRSSALLSTSTSTRTRESPSSVVLVLTAVAIGRLKIVEPGGSVPSVAPLRRNPAERLQAWLVTGPLGHLWSVLADIAILFARYGVHRLRRGRA